LSARSSHCGLSVAAVTKKHAGSPVPWEGSTAVAGS
jgi:hypothetical protein